MGFQEAKQSLETASKQLDDIWAESYHCASEIIKGNWQDPNVMKLRREMAVKIADKIILNKKLVFAWET